jgi:ATP-binding cassette subfamily B protein
MGDRLNIMFQGHVARLQAQVATVEHHERPVYLADRMPAPVFALDHLFRSMFTMVGWLLRLAFVCILLAAIHPALLLLPLAALLLLAVAVWRPKRSAPRSASPPTAGSAAIFTVATTPPAGKEVRARQPGRPRGSPAYGVGHLVRPDPGVQPGAPPG